MIHDIYEEMSQDIEDNTYTLPVSEDVALRQDKLKNATLPKECGLYISLSPYVFDKIQQQAQKEGQSLVRYTTLLLEQSVISV